MRRRRPGARLVPALLAWALLAAAPGWAQDEEPEFSLEGLLGRVSTFLNENLGDGELVLPEPDPAQADRFLSELQAQLEGEYVLDLLPFKRTVDFLLPLMEAHESLQDLGAWLRSRRDYFEVVDELVFRVPSPGTEASGPIDAGPTNGPLAKGATNWVLRPAGTNAATVVGPGTNAVTPLGLTNRVTVQVVDAEEDEEEPLALNVVILPPRVGPGPTPVPRSVGTNRWVAVPGVARPPAPPSVRRRNPDPEQVRLAWTRQMAQRELPAGARQWVPRLKPIFASEGVPEELVWLAEVESGFDPRARSPAGAVGLYQLMPVTARSLGLVSFPFDQRKSPEKSARAAAQYLRSLYGQFEDWPLALAAYNAGPTRVRSLLTAEGGTRFAAIAGRLPVETQLYVPKFDAVLRRRERRGLADLPPAIPGRPTTGGE